MSWYCIHENSWDGNYYEPPERWCELDKAKNYDYDCDNCPYRYSKEDYEADRADYEYTKYRDSF